ncbi:transcriptional regulator, GntR family [Thermomonospora curvata DSM 43183]|uniref:Transcriptional regulator, GntR family n=1 Tax=Thermomonospora curvata (strain ATCC 19995 / DSM 43183 / JCM 3096 / KCTC 9072 / NBRC 15933 / NCIMB 10081 / Henssen B9) TaxID=471852 RepID=D1A676_THECD|nr:transcriptional regulator, GntR family [Thermomonospora curvata DSM 43183]
MEVAVRSDDVGTLDVADYTPAYAKVAAAIREAILFGELAPGQAIPSEAQLVQQYGVARETVRRAVAMLRGEGLIVTEHARGSYVREVPERREVIIRPAAVVTSRMPTADERDRLDLPEGVPVLVVEQSGQTEMYPADRVQLRVQG